MNDTDLIKLLRERVTTLELAILDFHDAMEPVGMACKEAYEATIADKALLRAEGFLATYGRTLAARSMAAEALAAALTTDFRTAVLTGADWTEEQRAEWLAACDEDEEDGAKAAAAPVPEGEQP